MRRLWIVVIVLVSLATLGGLGFAVANLIGSGDLTTDHRGTDGDVGPIVLEDDDFGTVEMYEVDDAGTLNPTPASDSLTASVWATFVRVATPEFAADVMIEYQVGDAPDSDTLAYVHRSDDPEYWVLAANLASSDDLATLVPTLIHEYSHILTLSTEQIDPDAASCSTLELDEGCANPESTMQRFEEQFWAGYTDAPDASNSSWDVTDAFYAEHSEDFVSDYAATNVVEDVAESFMTFVMEDRPTGDSVVAAKLEFFWAVPEYVAIRERIRAEFASDLGLVP